MEWAKGRDLRAAACALLCALFGMAWQADAALATDGRVTIVKRNVGGDPADPFAFSANLVPAQAGFSLLGGGKQTFDVDCNTGATCAAGARQVTETPADGYTMTGVVCRTTTGTPPALPDEPTDADPVDADTTVTGTTIDFKVDPSEWVKCTVTNTRDRGSIRVVKVVEGVPGYGDSGRFDLLVDGQVQADEVADGGVTPAVDVPTGTHTVGEAAGALTSLADYDRRVDCSAPGKLPVVDTTDSDLPLSVGKGENWTCVITNTRRRGMLTVVKDLRPATDVGRFDLTIDGLVKAIAVGHGGTTGAVAVPTGTHTVGELAAGPVALDGYTSSIGCRNGAADRGSVPGSGPRSVTVNPGDDIVCTIVNTRRDARIQVLKTGPSIAYSGDLLSFGFDVTNPGNEPLTAITLTDDRCASVQGPTLKEVGDPDDVLDAGERWHYICSYTATHAMGDPNPVVNTATASAQDPFGRIVRGTGSHETRFLHPAIAIDKDGPAAATAGDLLTYTMAVTNAGDATFVEPLGVTDPLCLTPPALTSKGGDLTLSTLDPGDTWTFSCQVQSRNGETQVAGEAGVRAVDANGHAAQARDAHTTTLTPPVVAAIDAPAPTVQAATWPQAFVAPARVIAGTARLRGPTGCPAATAVATVTGRRIAGVTWFLDGRVVARTHRADSAGRWRIAVRTRSLRYGTHRLRARVRFETASRTAARTLSLPILRCPPAVRTPRFTG
jgi:uncharacterized repeat protein (TIGR01451 family)